MLDETTQDFLEEASQDEIEEKDDAGSSREPDEGQPTDNDPSEGDVGIADVDDADNDAAGDASAADDVDADEEKTESDQGQSNGENWSDDREGNLSDEELDAVADAAIAILQGILKYLNVGEITIDEYEGDEGELILDITGDDLAVLIGRHGKTLDAIQTLVSAVTVRKMGFRHPIVVDVEGYKNRQRQKLESMAQSAANRAAGQNKSIKLRPMMPYERRIIHVSLRHDERVETASEGEGSARHVVVIPQ
ncbi:MAG: KH domain-containing protein [Eggerthellaceae bacterium]|nr:KH domain-containing protein [Eggerthellaceae bacterium]